MGSDLDLLIDFYQREKQGLLLEIEENKRGKRFKKICAHGRPGIRL